MKFRGAHNLNLDTKGRIGIPTRFRDYLVSHHAGQLIITIDSDEPCLRLYPQSEWEVIEAKLESLPSFNKYSRRIKSLMMGYATEVEMDSNGRALIPPPLREFAKLDKKTVLRGQGKGFELWDEDTWLATCETWMQEGTLKAENEDLPPDLLNLSL